MRRLHVEFQQQARADLTGIFRLVLLASRHNGTAERFVRRIKRRCDGIGDAPRGGRPRGDLEPGLRTVPFEHSAMIAYRVETNRVLITNIFYGGRDYEALYREQTGMD